VKYRTFQPQFHQPILSGVKISTIRGSQWCNVGDRVALRYWIGSPYRSKMGILSTAIVDLVATVVMNDDGVFVDGVYQADQTLPTQEGFRGDAVNGWPRMMSWFEKTHGLPYSGILTRWDPASLELLAADAKGDRG